VNINYLIHVLLDNIRNLITGKPVPNDPVKAINTITQHSG
jgi:hypothetical protein